MSVLLKRIETLEKVHGTSNNLPLMIFLKFVDSIGEKPASWASHNGTKFYRHDDESKDTFTERVSVEVRATTKPSGNMAHLVFLYPDPFTLEG